MRSEVLLEAPSVLVEELLDALELGRTDDEARMVLACLAVDDLGIGVAAEIGILVAGLVVGLAAWAYQLANGLAATNMRNPMMWGLYITLFMYFVGLSAGGLIVASAGRLFGATRLKPVVRIAVLEATVAVMIAALLLLPDIGRPDRAWHLLRYAHLTSPLIWDLTIVTVYLLISATYVWVYTRADLAARGSRLALGTGTTLADAQRDERM